jgi:ABC-type lipoprotein release transport system permease subunit
VPLELRLAWRNVWRNPRRTGLTIAATVFAVVLVVFFVAMAAGVHEKMIEDAVRVSSGHVLVAGPGYLEKRSLEQFVRLDERLAEAVDATPGVRAWTPRVVGFGLLSKDASTRGVAVLGVDPRREPTVTTLAERVRRGSFVTGRAPFEIVLGERLARNLGVGLGEQVLLYSVAYSLETAYELFRVVGIMKLPDANLDRSLAVIGLADAQAYFVYGDRVSEVAILAESADTADAIRSRLAAALAGDSGAEAHTWSEVMPELVQFIFLDDAGMYMLLVVLVVVVAFGILNTILMAVLERKREFGVLLALGLRPRSVFRIVYLESMLLASTGLAMGLAVAIPLVLWFQAHPIELGAELAEAMEMFGAEPVMTWKLKPMNPIGSVLTILGVAFVAALYPALKASRGRPVDVLRSL